MYFRDGIPSAPSPTAPGTGVPAPSAESAPEPASLPPIPFPPETPRPVAPTDGSTLWASHRAHRLFKSESRDFSEALAAEPATGGAWMGWGVFEPETSASGGGTHEAYTLPLGGGLMDTVADSECVALPERSHSPRTLGAPLAWQARLDRLRASRGKRPVPGLWHLCCWHPMRALLMWGFAMKNLSVPWADCPDFDSLETWRQRWERKAAEDGHPDLPSPCLVGSTARGAWWVGITPSIAMVSSPVPQVVHPRAVDEAWRAQMEDFCRIMGIPPQASRWHLVADKGD